jgi:hypothetical protein
MSAVLIDANVLLDVMAEDARWLAWSAEAIEGGAEQSDRHFRIFSSAPMQPLPDICC